ncbi:hypothetical protein J1N35_031024 [Gossypium stocksii]|uniref:Uncharacterized protein n=1 Tax=Gossypium stocksii TaxID=47602 RepID=A0A9D3ZUP3_9ROSI|nr:hypothetical protein J1N35_031024 [Gossypium stocksii]
MNFMFISDFIPVKMLLPPLYWKMPHFACHLGQPLGPQAATAVKSLPPHYPSGDVSSLCLAWLNPALVQGTVKIPEVTGAIQDFNSQLLRYKDGTEIPMHETVIEGWNFTSHLLHYKDGTGDTKLLNYKGLSDSLPCLGNKLLLVMFGSRAYLGSSYLIFCPEFRPSAILKLRSVLFYVMFFLRS